MNFIEAVKAMKDGNKVKRACRESYYYVYTDRILSQYGGEPTMFVEDVIADDWEINKNENNKT